MSIKKLDSQSITKISVNQVVVDLAACVKELLENSLDANSTKIGNHFKFSYQDIIVYDSGLKGLKVVDDGSGIEEDSLNLISNKKRIKFKFSPKGSHLEIGTI